MRRAALSPGHRGDEFGAIGGSQRVFSDGFRAFTERNAGVLFAAKTPSEIPPVGEFGDKKHSGF